MHAKLCKVGARVARVIRYAGCDRQQAMPPDKLHLCISKAGLAETADNKAPFKCKNNEEGHRPY